jgi:6-phosphogluconolactonase
VGGNSILIFRLDETHGTLLPQDPPSVPFRPQSKPRHFTFHPRLDVLYCVNEYAGTLAAFAIDRQTGGLTELQYEALVAADYEGNARAADVQVTADGRFVYATVRNTHTIVGFRIDRQSGCLTRIGTFEAPASPRSFALDPYGRFLLCAGEHDNTLTIFAIDPDTGALTRRHSYPIGLQPTWVEAVRLPHKLAS